MIAAASDTLWDNGRVCGKMFTVKCSGPRNAVPHPCTGKSVKVKIVDHCPSGCASTLDFLEKLLLRSLILSLGLLTLIIFHICAIENWYNHFLHIIEFGYAEKVLVTSYLMV
ncbi:hypothetical protein AXX17_AT4G34840 [Arabidopsis thaliana]|uniref:Expansin-like EG45 domain-containing protein n=1 Tax=Arabidopsis thaliana TaxID=3702 RepID=A0A178UVQ0_ARATH|nr:hypothetical protein AXX17_AT4G34840 [Arabidopsis thaliana]